ncbi:MAG: LssY C-terminal domain-containing protein, partial [Pirellulaceae bacterium]|nr:LssY C-terminal domain-containing protein [Pirellulaceae bacterium]
MPMSVLPPDADQQPPRRTPLWRRAAFGLGMGLCVYLIVAYLVMPALWKRYERRHPALADTPGITRTGDGHPGDPINVALIGSEAEVRSIMRAAGWFPADPLGLKSDLKIAADTVLKRPYDEAPVSSLYLFGRKE